MILFGNSLLSFEITYSFSPTQCWRGESHESLFFTTSHEKIWIHIIVKYLWLKKYICKDSEKFFSAPPRACCLSCFGCVVNLFSIWYPCIRTSCERSQPRQDPSCIPRTRRVSAKKTAGWLRVWAVLSVIGCLQKRCAQTFFRPLIDLTLSAKNKPVSLQIKCNQFD